MSIPDPHPNRGAPRPTWAHWPILSIVILALVTPYLVWRLYFYHESPTDAAKRVCRCLVADDSGCLYGYLSPEEQKGMSEDAFARFIRGYWAPVHAGYRPTGPIALNFENAGSRVIASWPLRKANGQQIHVGALIEDMDCAPKAIDIVAMTFRSSLTADWPPGALPRGMARLKILADSAANRANLAQKSGLPGCIVGAMTPKRQFLSWPELAAWYQSKVDLAAYHQSLKSP